jgi:DNA-binding transcriptional regulator YdaS (Cro superfamily)
MRDSVIDEAIAVAGGPTALARQLGIRMPSLYSWRRVPPPRVLAIEAATGIPRTRLRPDLYPPEEPGAPPERRRAA